MVAEPEPCFLCGLKRGYEKLMNLLDDELTKIPTCSIKCDQGGAGTAGTNFDYFTSPGQISWRYCNSCELRWYIASTELSKQEDSQTSQNAKPATCYEVKEPDPNKMPWSSSETVRSNACLLIGEAT